MQTYAFVVAGIVALIVSLILRSKTNDEALKPAAAKSIGITVSGIVVVCLALILHHQFKHWGIL